MFDHHFVGSNGGGDVRHRTEPIRNAQYFRCHVFYIATHAYESFADNATVGTMEDRPHLALGQEMVEGLYKKYCPSNYVAQ